MPLASAQAGAFVRSGKVRDLYQVDADRLLLVASDRISAFDVVLPTPIPDKGRVLTGLSRFWFGQTGRHRPEPPALDRPRRTSRPAGPRARPARRAARPDDDRPSGRAAAGRGDRPRLPVGHGLEGLPRHRPAVRDPAACRPARKRPAARADLHALDERGRRRPRPQHRPRGAGWPARRWARGTRPGGPSRGRGPVRSTDSGPAGRSGSGSSWPTRSSSSGCCRTARCSSSTRS